jgi:hypothetical protein
MLTKMCELIDAENPDINAFIVGPGWTKTKIHQLIAQDPHVSEQKREETETFIKGDEGTSLDDIYQCIEWLRSQGRGASGGRNFSVVHDPWRGSKRNALEEALASDPNMYKLRRSGNAFGHESPSSIH